MLILIIKEILTENYFDKLVKKMKLKNENLSFFKFEKKDAVALKDLDLTHWSSYENWIHIRITFLKKCCGLKNFDSNNSGTFTNFAQNDQALVALHTYTSV